VDYASLLDIAKLLLSSEEPNRTAETILRRVSDFTSATRGFIVVREGKSFEEKFDIRFESGSVSGEEHRFSRSLVRKAIATRSVLTSESALADPRFAGAESIERMGPRAVLVVPLQHEGDVYGVVYLERLAPSGPFDPDAVRFVSDFAELAALFIRGAAEREGLRRRNRSLERDLFAQCDFRGIVTRNPRMLALLKMVGQVAASDATILIRGETGTGKELVAQAIHVNSVRSTGPLVVLHCTALPSTILESELFGHVKGAFTGADRNRLGRIASAHRGTLFLDEIAEIPPEAQAKLLRFLQFGEIQRLGTDRVEKVDVRVVAATHQNLEQLVQAGKFRQDLYYRLKVIDLELPPLRDRADDIPLLVESFLAESASSGERRHFSEEAIAVLAEYAYPGNVRELRHVVERACVLATGPVLDVDLLPADVLVAAPPAPVEDNPEESVRPDTDETAGPLGELVQVRRAASDAAERVFIATLLERSKGNVSLAARTSGIHRSYLQRLIAKHGLRRT
jgi:transcriptional regulator with GAF, ATPase, and Fis domain